MQKISQKNTKSDVGVRPNSRSCMRQVRPRVRNLIGDAILAYLGINIFED